MSIIKQIATICVLLAIAGEASAQWFPETLLGSPSIVASDSNRLSLKVDMTGFFKNNEYFSPIAVGQTYPGVMLLPTLNYQASDKFRAEAGAYMVHFSGRNDFSLLQPFLRLQYAFTPAFSMVLGNLYGDLNHRLIEPLYQWEQHFTARPESGLQFVWHGDRLFADTWIDWERYIERNDTVPEVLTFGASVIGRLFAPDKRFFLNIPVQLLIHHQGGQIDLSHEPGMMLTNAAIGISTGYRLNRKWLQSVAIDIYDALYFDSSDNRASRPYEQGHGVYSVLHLDAAPFALMVGYWHAEKFYAFQGEPLFASFDRYNPLSQLPVRNLLTAKLAFDKTVYKGIAIGAYAETYTDIDRGETDYSFGVHIRFCRSFTLINTNADRSR
ncbi:MAG: hypothetical protein LBV39_06245 [Bacteroidales bacterium]|jgi:hypothetical protein|nr:hypothetical protein [Bacteroidales bacterium]